MLIIGEGTLGAWTQLHPQYQELRNKNHQPNIPYSKFIIFLMSRVRQLPKGRLVWTVGLSIKACWISLPFFPVRAPECKLPWMQMATTGGNLHTSGVPGHLQYSDRHPQWLWAQTQIGVGPNGFDRFASPIDFNIFVCLLVCFFASFFCLILYRHGREQEVTGHRLLGLGSLTFQWGIKLFKLMYGKFHYNPPRLAACNFQIEIFKNEGHRIPSLYK